MELESVPAGLMHKLIRKLIGIDYCLDILYAKDTDRLPQQITGEVGSNPERLCGSGSDRTRSYSGLRPGELKSVRGSWRQDGGEADSKLALVRVAYLGRSLRERIRFSPR